VESAAVHEVLLPLRRPHRTAGTEIGERRILLLHLVGPGGEGWGECGPIPGYSLETYEECLHWLTDVALPRVLSGRDLPVQGPPAAAFSVETARADLESRAAGIPLWQSLGGTRDRVEIGAVVGFDVDDQDVPAAAEALAAAGYRRVKLKVAPGRDRRRIAAASAVLGGAALAVDANASYHPHDPPEFLDAFGLDFVEQPFPPDAWEASAALARSIETPICLDESIDGVPAAVRALETEAAGIINVKPARVGGLRAAVAVHDAAAERGAPVWCGGMLESAIGRSAALAIATLPGMSLPADLAPSGRNYEDDLSDRPHRMVEGAIPIGELPGLGVRPDPVSLGRSTTGVHRFDAA
jgi:O-succinylbenzoate synthase